MDPWNKPQGYENQRESLIFPYARRTLVSPKNCSLAYEVEEDYEGNGNGIADAMEPNLRVHTYKHTGESSSVDEIVFVKGRINVSF